MRKIRLLIADDSSAFMRVLTAMLADNAREAGADALVTKARAGRDLAPAIAPVAAEGGAPA